MSTVWFVYMLLLFFFKQKTAYEMRISDWSSDVCSSDLLHARELPQGRSREIHAQLVRLGECAVRAADRRGRGQAPRAAGTAAVMEARSMTTTSRRQLLATTGLLTLGSALPVGCSRLAGDATLGAGKPNLFIGTGGHGHTFPGASLPFGMAQLSPDTNTHGWDA